MHLFFLIFWITYCISHVSDIETNCMEIYGLRMAAKVLFIIKKYNANEFGTKNMKVLPKTGPPHGSTPLTEIVT